MKQSIGIDYDTKNIVIIEDGKVAHEERLPFIDDIRRIRVKLAKGIIPVCAVTNVLLKPLKLHSDIKLRDIPESVKWQFRDMDDNFIVHHCITGKTVNNWWLVITGAVAPKMVEQLTNKTIKFGLDNPCVVDLRIFALWRGVKHLHPNSENALLAIEETSAGARVVAGRNNLEFAREISGDNMDFEIQSTINHYKAEFTDQVEVVNVGRELPENIAALGMALYPFVTPGVNYNGVSKARAVLSRDVLELFGLTKRRLLLYGGLFLVWLGLIFSPCLASWWFNNKISAIHRDIAGLNTSLAESNSIAKEINTIDKWCLVLQSFKPLQTSLQLDDLRYALPQGVWITGLKSTESTVIPQQANKPVDKPVDVNNPDHIPAEAKQVPTVQTQQTQSNSSEIQTKLPALPGGFQINGYAADSVSIAAARDNFSKLPWVENARVASMEYKDSVYEYTITIATKRGILNG